MASLYTPYSSYASSSYTTTTPTTTSTTTPTPTTPYYPTSPTSPGLPAEEYQYLRKQQQRQHLESQLRSRSNTSPYFTHSPTYSQTAFQQAGLAHAQRVHISEVRNATRKALGANFDFADEKDRGNGGGRTVQRRPAHTSTTTTPRPRERMPQHHVDALSARWSEAEMQEQYARSRAARMQQNMHGATTASVSRRRDHSRAHDDSTSTARRHDSGVVVSMDAVNEFPGRSAAGGAMPQLKSKFSFDSDDDDDDDGHQAETSRADRVKKPKRRFWRHLCL